MTVAWGVLSTARINDAFLAGAARSAEVEVVAVASRDAARAAEYARRHDIPASHGSYEALLADPGVEAVYISLPNGMHLEWTRRALESGKHVLCEKPLSRDPEAVAGLFDLAEQRGLVLSEAFMYRHHPQTLRLAELVAGGAIGTPRAIRSHFSFVLADPADVRLAPHLEGGALMDLGCYCVNGARLLAGEPESVTGVQVLSGEDGVDLSFAGALRFGSGVVAQFDCSFAAAPAHALEVAGDRGSLLVRDPWHCREVGIELSDADGTRRIEIEPADSYELEAQDVSRAVRGEAPARLGRDDAVGQARTIAELYAAASG